MPAISPDTMNTLLEVRSRAQGVSIDTRVDLTNQIFVAIQGANFDGNEFVATCVCMQGPYTPSPLTPPGVSTPTSPWSQTHSTHCSNLPWLTETHGPVPCLPLTGSNGKTTTKELIRDVLATTFKVHATAGNLNNHIGVPLTLLNAPNQPEFVCG